MADALYLDKPGADGIIKEIQTQIAALSDAVHAIDNRILSLDSVWRGVSASKCQTKYSDGYQEMLTKTVPETVDGLKEFIKQCVAAIKDVDDSLAGA